MSEAKKSSKKKNTKKTHKLVSNQVAMSIKRSSYSALEVYNILANSDKADLKEILKRGRIPVGLKIAVDFMIKNNLSRDDKLEVLKLYFEALNKVEEISNKRTYNILRNKLIETQIKRANSNDAEVIKNLPNINFLL